MNEYCISYSIEIHYETGWFKAKSKEEAIKHVKEIVGNDITPTSVVMHPKKEATRA